MTRQDTIKSPGNNDLTMKATKKLVNYPKPSRVMKTRIGDVLNEAIRIELAKIAKYRVDMELLYLASIR